MVDSEVLGGPAGGRALEVARDEFSFLLTRVVPADVLSPPLFFLLSAGIGLSPTRSRVLFGSLVAVCPSECLNVFFCCHILRHRYLVLCWRQDLLLRVI